MKNIFQNQFPGMRENEPLKKHCAYRIGGAAEWFYELKKIEELPALIKLAEEKGIPWFIFGQGANVLFPDEGVQGLVIKNLAGEITVEDDEIMAESGALLGSVIQAAGQHGLNGIQNLAGIPGTIGGAVVGNAGAFKTEIGDFVTKVDVFAPGKGEATLEKSALEFGYRESIFKKQPGGVILRVYLKLKKAEKPVDTAEILKKRKKIKGFYCGSFFKNPSANQPAGLLIEKCGLKGHKIGDAQISEEHANFIVNLGEAQAKDVLALAELVKEKVKEKFGVELEEEVKVVKIR